MSLAIHVTYVGHTEKKPARYRATNGDFTHSFSVEECERQRLNPYKGAAILFCRKHGWTGTLAMGGDKNGYVFVFVDEHCVFPVTKGAS